MNNLLKVPFDFLKSGNLSNNVKDFIWQLLAHHVDIEVSILLIYIGTYEDTLREEELDIIFNQSHVKGVCMETMNKEN